MVILEEFLNNELERRLKDQLLDFDSTSWYGLFFTEIKKQGDHI